MDENIKKVKEVIELLVEALNCPGSRRSPWGYIRKAISLLKPCQTCGGSKKVVCGNCEGQKRFLLIDGETGKDFVEVCFLCKGEGKVPCPDCLPKPELLVSGPCKGGVKSLPTSTKPNIQPAGQKPKHQHPDRECKVENCVYLEADSDIINAHIDKEIQMQAFIEEIMRDKAEVSKIAAETISKQNDRIEQLEAEKNERIEK